MAYRCSVCGIDWPYNFSNFKNCLRCGGKTDCISNGDPLSAAEADVWKRRQAFERFYEESRGVPASSESDPDTDPKRAELKPWCDCERADGLICWACDPIPKRPSADEPLVVPDWVDPRDG